MRKRRRVDPVAGKASSDGDSESKDEEARKCIVCFAEERTHMATPCGHMALCAKCTAKLDKCLYCRAPAARWVKLRMV